MGDDLQVMKQPKLDKPGAGLPWPQSWITRMIVPPMARRFTWDECAAKFALQSEKVQKMVQPLDDVTIQARVLVPRLRGLEDSSRFWSVSMTLEHLIIVGDGVADIIVKLAMGEKPKEIVETANVKPQEKYIGTAARLEFAAMAQRVRHRLETEIVDRDSKVTHDHPWFGPFTARQWHWLLGGHTVIHRDQIRSILQIHSKE